MDSMGQVYSNAQKKAIWKGSHNPSERGLVFEQIELLIFEKSSYTFFVKNPFWTQILAGFFV